jgi:polygalacturonase
VKLDGIRIHNRVNKNNDGFHFNSSEYVNISNCNIACQDDACALFGSNKFVTVTNCSFSTRWSIFRFGGGQCENIAVSNCIIYETYGCPIKMRCGARSRLENISFSNIVMKDVTGPISIGLDSSSRRANDNQPPQKGVVRNISFNGIRATVVATGKTHDDLPFKSDFRPGETRQCIVLNGVGDDMLEDISFTDVHITYEGGGTAEEAGNRDVPKKAGEYFEIGTPPAYGMFARNVRNLTLHNVRLQVKNPDLRPAVVFDNVEDASLTTVSVQGNPHSESAIRVINSKEIVLSSPRLLTPASSFMQVEGDKSQNITIDGGDISKAARPLAFAAGATEKSVKLRA